MSDAPFILPSSVRAAETKPNDRITMGFIGVGKQNRYLLNTFLQYERCRVVSVCNVDTTRRESAQQDGERALHDSAGGKLEWLTREYGSPWNV